MSDTEPTREYYGSAQSLPPDAGDQHWYGMLPRRALFGAGTLLKAYGEKGKKIPEYSLRDVPEEKIDAFYHSAYDYLRYYPWHVTEYKEIENRENIKIYKCPSPDTSESQILDGIQISPDDIGLRVTLIGGRDMPYARIEKISTAILSNALTLLHHDWTTIDQEKEMVVTAAATAIGGVMDATHYYRLWTYFDKPSDTRPRRDPLVIGVAPIEKVAVPMQREPDPEAEDEQEITNTDMSHVAYAPNKYPQNPEYGPWKTISEGLVDLSLELGKKGKHFTILADGGDGAMIELPRFLRQGEPVITMKGSGRLADAVALWKENGDRTVLSDNQQKYLAQLDEQAGEHAEAWRQQIHVYSPFEYDTYQEAVNGLFHEMKEIIA
jgi:hypothetical protein